MLLPAINILEKPAGLKELQNALPRLLATEAGFMELLIHSDSALQPAEPQRGEGGRSPHFKVD